MTYRDISGAPPEVFVWYAEEDETLAQELSAQLMAVERQGILRLSGRHRLLPGDDRAYSIERDLARAQLVLMLVSAEFLVLYDDAVKRLLEASHFASQARIVPVIVRECPWRAHPIARLEVLPRSRVAIKSWSDRDEAWADVVREVCAALDPSRLSSAGSAGGRLVAPYVTDEHRRLAGEIQAAVARRDRLREAGRSTRDQDEKILSLKRQLREGGQLQAGDYVGGDRYLLLDPLGRGSFGSVWKARDRKEGRDVAIKVLHANLAGDAVARERFFRGARVMSNLAHDGVVRILDPRGDDGGFHYFVMDLLPGGNLADAVKRGLSVERSLQIISSVASALSALHAKGLFHRDVKPDNILLDDGGNAKLTDFDLTGGQGTTGGTRAGAMGTFLFAAPELMQAAQEAGARADVFGLGMTAVFAIAGKLDPEVYRLPEPHIAKLSCPRRVKSVLKRAVAWEPSRRYADARHFAMALRGAVPPETPSGQMQLVATASRAHPKLDPRLAALLELPPGSLDLPNEELEPERAVRATPGKVPVFVTTEGNASQHQKRGRFRSIAGNIATALLSTEEISKLEAEDGIIAIEWPGGADPTSDDATPEDPTPPREAIGLREGNEERFDGRGCIIGIVDFEGIDLYHPDFLTPTGRSRVVALWDQTRSTLEAAESAPEPWGYGVEYSQEAIQFEVSPGQPWPFSVVRQRVAKRSHGTMSASIAAGADWEGRAAGVAPGADIIFVNAFSSESRSLTAMTELAEAVDYVFRRADALGKPCVVNLGLGEDLGPGDGTSAVERFIDALLEEKPGRAVTVPAGNSAMRGPHLAGCVKAGTCVELSFDVGPRNRETMLIEIWLEGESTPSFEVKAPGQLGSTGIHEADGLARVYVVGGARLLVSSARIYPGARKGLIRLELFMPDEALAEIPPGYWTIVLRASPDVGCEWYACLKHRYIRWTVRDEDVMSITSPGTCRSAITVGACMSDGSAFFFSGRGPARDGNLKPDVVALGGPLRAASAITPARHVPASGSSMACSLVAGQVALLFQACGPLPATEVKRRIRETAQRAADEEYDPARGFGRADAGVMLRTLVSRERVTDEEKRRMATRNTAEGDSLLE